MYKFIILNSLYAQYRNIYYFTIKVIKERLEILVYRAWIGIIDLKKSAKRCTESISDHKHTVRTITIEVFYIEKDY